MREKGPKTIIEFNTTSVRVCSSVFSRRFKEQRLARLFSFPAVDSDKEASLLLSRHLRAYQVRPRHVTLVLPRPRAILSLHRYDRILSEAGVLPERVILHAGGVADFRQDSVDVMPPDLRAALSVRRQRQAWRRRSMALCVFIFCWCVLMSGHIKDQEARIRRMAQVLFGYKATATGLLRQEAMAALEKDLLRSQAWQQRLSILIGALPASITLTQMRLGMDNSLDLAGRAGDVDEFMAYIGLLEKDRRFLHVRWEITDVSKEGMSMFRVRTKRS
jgi:hypothetical protein